ncbi:MAG: hypothetical protein IPK17_19455 [Chloroflexi bacterium]|uniref:hypothetical protein n=1 Tax=Candidatus Flexifilum breve TaxID=3140694 RepID=UPI003136BD0A|nr:hypothetical protein [Chloroflexota bacterium]
MSPSPVPHVKAKNTPPTFLWATAADALVPAENSTRMATALAAAGVQAKSMCLRAAGTA